MRISGSSMRPALRDRDVVLVLLGGRPRPGDVVLVRWAQLPGRLSVKRAVRPQRPGWYVTGDNPGSSADSREMGPAEVLGVVRWRLWPRPGPIGYPACWRSSSWRAKHCW